MCVLISAWCWWDHAVCLIYYSLCLCHAIYAQNQPKPRIGHQWCSSNEEFTVSGWISWHPILMTCIANFWIKGWDHGWTLIHPWHNLVFHLLDVPNLAMLDPSILLLWIFSTTTTMFPWNMSILVPGFQQKTWFLKVIQHRRFPLTLIKTTHNLIRKSESVF